MRRGRPQVQLIDDGGAVAVDVDPGEPIATRTRLRLTLVGLILLPTLSYLPVVWHRFGVADDVNVTENLVLRGGKAALGAIWRHPSITPQFGPLAYTFFMGQYRLFGANHPAGYHLISLGLHVLNVVLLWRFLRRLELRGAFAAAAIFAIHPVVAEAVAWISAQPLLWCATFSLASLLFAVRDFRLQERLPAWKAQIPAILFLAAALASNVAGAAIPFVLAMILYWRSNGRLRRLRSDLLLLLSMLVISIGCIAVVWISQHRRAGSMGVDSSVSAIEQLSVAARSLWLLAGHVLAPVHLAFTYPKWPTSGAASLLPLAGLISVLVLLWALRSRIGTSPFVAATLFVLVSLPLLGLADSLVHSDAYVADYLAYLPAMVLISAIVAGIRGRMSLENRVSEFWLPPTITILALLFLIVLTLTRLGDYRDRRSMWASTLRKNPGSSVALNHLGLIDLYEDNDRAAAMRRFALALERKPNDIETNLNIAKVYRESKELDKEITQYYQVLSTDPNNVEAHFGLAQALAQQGHSAEAIAEYETVLKLQPGHRDAMNNIGMLHADRGEIDQAIASYERAIQIDPSFPVSYINLASLLYQESRRRNGDDALSARAEHVLVQCITINPTSFEAWFNAGTIAGERANEAGQPDDAREARLNQSETFFRKAVQLRPDSSLAWTNLGIVSARRQKFDDAVYALQRAIELDPNDLRARANLENVQKALSQQSRPSR